MAAWLESAGERSQVRMSLWTRRETDQGWILRSSALTRLYMTRMNRKQAATGRTMHTSRGSLSSPVQGWSGEKLGWLSQITQRLVRLEKLDRLDREKRVEKLDSGRGFAEGLGRLEGGA